MPNTTNVNATGARHATPCEAQAWWSHAGSVHFRAYVRCLSGPQVEEQWRAYKTGFIAIASAPSHGLDASQLHTIWLLHWADRLATAARRCRAILDAKYQYEDDRAALVPAVHSYRDDRLYAALGPEYHHALTEASNASFMFAHSTAAHEILRGAAGTLDAFTLEQLDQAVVGVALEALERGELQ